MNTTETRPAADAAPETSPAADAAPETFHGEPTPPPYAHAEDAPQTAAPETPAEEARRKRTTWPIRAMRCRDGGFFPIKDSPEWSRERDAFDWIQTKCPPDEKWIPVRHPENALRQRLEEVSPW